MIEFCILLLTKVDNGIKKCCSNLQFLSALENHNHSQIQVKIKICAKLKSALAVAYHINVKKTGWVEMKFFNISPFSCLPVQENNFYEGM